MTNPLTPAERDELTRLYHALRVGNYNGATIQRFRTLTAQAVQPEIERQIAARMAQATRRAEAREAARRAGQAAGRRAGRQFLSDAHRRAHDAAVAQNNRNRRR